MKEQRKILLGQEDIISRENEDIFLNVMLSRSYNELEKERFDNNFNIAEQFRQERNLSRNFQIYGIVDSNVSNCDNLQISYYPFNRIENIEGAELTSDMITLIQERRSDVDFNSFPGNTLEQKVKDWFDRTGRRQLPWKTNVGGILSTRVLVTTLNSIVEAGLQLQSPIGTVSTTPVALSGKNVFGYKKGKYLIELTGYEFNSVYIVIQGTGSFNNQLFRQSLVFFDDEDNFIDYGSETVEIARTGNITVVQNDFAFFYDKHWVKKNLTIDTNNPAVNATF